MSAAALPPEVRELLAAVLAALDIPLPATVGDHARYREVLEQRARHARLTLGRVQEPPGTLPLDLAFEVGWLRAKLTEHPPAGYHTGPWPGVPVDRDPQEPGQ
jgi:hypothetical protein